MCPALLTPSNEWNKVNVHMGDGLVHVEEGQEHLEAWVALLKAPHVLVQHRRKPLLVAVGTRIALLPTCRMISWNGFSCLPERIFS